MQIKSISNMVPEERMYTYEQSQQIRMQTGSIGHLRGDFAKSGNEFYTTWDNHNEKLNTDEFKAEFDEVINTFRFDKKYGGLLKDLNSMRKYCSDIYGGHHLKEYFYRVNTENYAYLFRCDPSPNVYNVYCYCYKKEYLDNHIKSAAKGIRFINPDYKTLFTLPDGEKIRITTPDGEKKDRVCRYIDEYHLEVGAEFKHCELYHICQFAELMERNGNIVIPLRSSLPEQCCSTLLETGEIIIIKRGEKGYYKSDIPFADKESAREIVNEYNVKLGVTKAQEEAMRSGSMFGFHVPGADPKNYDYDGKAIPPKGRDRGDSR